MQPLNASDSDKTLLKDRTSQSYANECEYSPGVTGLVSMFGIMPFFLVASPSSLPAKMKISHNDGAMSTVNAVQTQSEEFTLSVPRASSC